MLPVLAANGWRRVETVFEVDWTSAVPGVGSMTGTGTLYERLSPQDTVQTGPNTVSTDALLANSSSVPIGKNAGSPGLVIDESRKAWVTNWRAVGGSPNWGTAGGGTVTADATAGPDGSVLADRSQTTSGNGGYNCTAAYGETTLAHVWSYWHKAGSGGASGQSTGDIGSGTVFYLGFTGTEPSVWTKKSINIPVNGVSFSVLYPTEGRDRTSVGGLAAGARDAYVDFVNAETGIFPTETIGSGAGRIRAAPRWYRNVGSTCLAEDGSLRFYVECEPKGAFNEYQSDMTLWYVDANNNAVIDFATAAVKITIGGTLYTTPNTMSWSREDRLRIFVCVGGGQVTSVQYAVNASSPTRISTGSPPTFGALTVSGTLDFLQTNKTKVFSVRCQRLRCYKFNKKPSDF